MPPATAEDVRSLRRWLLVTGAWAVAATAIAVIALVTANRDDTAEIGARTANQIGRVQRDLNARLNTIETRLDELAPAADVRKLDNRLRKVEQAANRQGTRLERLGADVDDLQTQVDDLEQAVAEGGGDNAGTDTTDETTP